MRKPTLFGELIIMIVFLPILTLEGVEGKLFRPMALTMIFALVGSLVMSLTLMPVLASLLLPRKIEEREPLLMRIAHRIHAPILRFSMHHKTLVVGFAAETENLREYAQAKRKKKNIPLLAANLAQVRSLSLDLRPPLLDDLGLIHALHWLIQQHQTRASTPRGPAAATSCGGSEGITCISLRLSAPKSIAMGE